MAIAYGMLSCHIQDDKVYDPQPHKDEKYRHRNRRSTIEPLLQIYDALFSHYGDLHWWPGENPYEIMVGAILTQNTAWTNVEKAIARLAEDLTPQRIAAMPVETLEERIRPAGFFRQKARYLKAMTAWYARYNYDAEAVRRVPLDALRPEILSVKGIGNETADSILLYAFGLPSFVVDAYTMRHFARYPLKAGRTYAVVQAYCEARLPESAEIYNHFHALIVINGKEHCKKRPICAGCPLEGGCEKRIEE